MPIKSKEKQNQTKKKKKKKKTASMEKVFSFFFPFWCLMMSGLFKGVQTGSCGGKKNKQDTRYGGENVYG